MMSRQRVAIGVAAVLVGAAFAGGLLVGRGSSAEPAVKGRPGVLARGEFTSVEWSTRGRASIVRKNDGTVVLELRGFQTQQAPELFVLLEPLAGGSRRLVDELKSAWGNQNYVLSPKLASNLQQRVVIFCGKCNKVWGYARLAPVRTRA
jgi:Electron transfer DM13